MNNGIAEKDIRMKSMVQHKAPLWINTFATDSINENHPNAEALKQQILNNQAIVETIHDIIEDYENQRKQAWFPSKKRGMLYKKIKYLRGILSTTYHSKCPGGTKNEM